MDLSDPALLLALLLGVAGFVLYAKTRPPPPKPPRCRACDLEMERGDEIVDAEHPETRYIPGERQAHFHCPRCRWQRVTRY